LNDFQRFKYANLVVKRDELIKSQDKGGKGKQVQEKGGKGKQEQQQAKGGKGKK
jgi:hypothetical protein